MVRSSRSNPLALAVLSCLSEEPMHPYQIAQTLRLRAKEESVRLNYGALYGVVEGLERRGLIRAKETRRQGRRPERTVYEITDLGSREATDWLTELLAVPMKEYPQFMAGLSFIAGLPPEDALAALTDRAQALRWKVAKLRTLRRAAADAGLPRIFELEAEYETSQLVAELDFAERLVKEMADGSLEGLETWRGFYKDDETRERLMTKLAERMSTAGRAKAEETPGRAPLRGPTH
ncbi:MAG: PadR family transcriptional regulator [Acidimicrobiales bacterium]